MRFAFIRLLLWNSVGSVVALKTQTACVYSILFRQYNEESLYFIAAHYTPTGCPDIADPGNGNIVFTLDATAPFNIGTLAAFVCNEGFTLHGDKVLECVKAVFEDIWNSSAPICSGKLYILYKI